VTGARSDIKGIGYAVGSAIAFGTMAIFAKYAYDEGADSSALLALRFATATMLLGVFRAIVGRKRRTSVSLRIKLLLLGGFGYAFESSLFFAALEHADAGVVALVFYSYPTWTALLGLATKLDPFRPQLLAALVLGSAGVLLIFSAPSGSLAGPLLALGAAVAVAVYLIGIQVVAKNVDATASALWTAAGAAITTGAAALVTGQTVPPAAVPWAVSIAAVTAAAFVLLYSAIALVGSARASVAAMMEPVTTLVLAAILLAQPITPRIAAGAALVVASLPILAFAGRTRERADLAA
jgi:drug/metabolite transporter (DMT)-like permease